MQSAVVRDHFNLKPRVIIKIKSAPGFVICMHARFKSNGPYPLFDFVQIINNNSNKIDVSLH